MDSLKKRGFFQVHRSIYQNKDIPSRIDQSIFLHMVSSASHCKKTLFWKGSFIEVDRGECIYPIREEAKNWSMGRQMMRSVIDELIKFNMISTRCAKMSHHFYNKVTVIRIINYDKYNKDHINTNKPIKYDNSEVSTETNNMIIARQSYKPLDLTNPVTIGYKKIGEESPYNIYQKDGIRYKLHTYKKGAIMEEY